MYGLFCPEIVSQMRPYQFISSGDKETVADNWTERPNIDGKNLVRANESHSNRNQRWNKINELWRRCISLEVQETQNVCGIVVRVHHDIGTLIERDANTEYDDTANTQQSPPEQIQTTNAHRIEERYEEGHKIAKEHCIDDFADQPRNVPVTNQYLIC